MFKRFIILLLMVSIAFGYFEISNDVPTVFSDSGDQQWRMWAGNEKAETLFNDSSGILFDEPLKSIVIGKFTPGDYKEQVTSLGFDAANPTYAAFVTAMGTNAGSFNAGTDLSVIGWSAGTQNTGDGVSAIGLNAVLYNDGDKNTALGWAAFSGWTADTGRAGTVTNVDFANNKMTIGAGHGWGTGTYLNLKATTTGVLPAGLSSIQELWLTTDGTVLECLTDSFTDAGSGTHTLTPQVVYENSTGLGYNAQPDASKQIMLGDTNITEVKTTGSLTASGASLTGDLDMNDNEIVDVDYIDFNLVNGVSPAEGRLYWNDIDGTLNLTMKGSVVNQQMGLEVLLQGQNTAGTDILNGMPIRITGAHASGRPTFGLSDADDPAAAGSIGMATEDILTAGSLFGYGTTFGLVRDWDTSDWSVSDRLYVGNTPGILVNAPPSSDERKIFMGVVLKSSVEEGIVFVDKINVSYLRELSGNQFGTENANDIIQFDGTIWENRSSITILDNSALGDNDADTIDIHGITQIGDGGTTDYTEIEPDGTIEFVGAATVWDDLRFPSSTLTFGQSNAPTKVVYKGGLVLSFADAIDQNEEIIYFTAQLPHSYKEGSDLCVHVHWTPEDNTAGDVVWEFTHSWANIDGTFPGESTIPSTVACDETTDKHQLDDIGTLDGTGMTISSILICSLKRDSSNAADTYDGKEPYLHEIDFHYEIDTVGSRTELTK